MRGSENYWSRRATRRRFLGGTAAGAAGVAALGVVGCGDDDDDVQKSPGDSDNNGNNGAGQTPSPTQQSEQTVGGKLVWGANADMNPQSLPYNSSVWLFPIQYGVYDYLTKYQGFTLESEARMAESWEQVDEVTLTLKLRPGLKWHNGDPVTAEDVVFNFGALAESRSAVRGLAHLTEPSAPDENTVVVKLAEPLPGVFDLFNYMPIAHPPTYGDELLTARQVIGSGPFVFEEWVPGQHVRIVRNNDWWKPNRPFLDEIEYRIFPQTALATAVEVGEIHYTAFLDIPDAVRLSQSGKAVLGPGSEGYSMLYFSMNVEHEALRDKRVRQALNYAVDRERIAEEVMGGITPGQRLLFPPYSPAYDESLAERVVYDPARAKALLDEAGYTSDMPEIPLSFSASLVSTEGIMTIVQGDLQQLGVKSRLDKRESSVYIDSHINRTLPGAFSFLLGYAGMYPSTFFPAIKPPNLWHFNDPSFDEKLDDWFARGNVESTAQAAFREFNEFMLDEAFLNPVVANRQPHILSPRVGGFNVNVADDIRLEELSLQDG